MTDSERIDLAELRRLHEAATPWPWIIETGPYSGRNWLVGFGNCGADGEDYSVTTDGLHASDCNGATAGDDCRLTAAARNALPALLRLAEAAMDMSAAARHTDFEFEDAAMQLWDALEPFRPAPAKEAT